MSPTATQARAGSAERALRLHAADISGDTLPSRGPAARDRALVRWIGRLGAATVDQVRERFALGRTVAYRRIAACVEGGLLERVYLLHGQPALLRASSRGLRYAGLALPVARLSPELAGHWVACAWVALRIPRETGIELVTERELRLHERVEGRALASATLYENGDGSERLHRPDLVLVGDGSVVAIEVELTPKSPARLEAIVKAWRRARCVDSVRYYAAAGATMRGLERAVERRRAEERVELRPVEGALVRREPPPTDLSEVGSSLLELALICAGMAAAAIALTLLLERSRLHWSSPGLAVPLSALGLLTSPMLGGAIACVLVASAGIGLGRHLQDLERGGPEARRAKERPGPIAVARASLAIRRARTDRLAGERFVVGSAPSRGTVTLPLGVRQGVRGFVPGAPGSGKTVTLAAHASAYIRAGLAAVVIDPKGDRYLRSVLASEAERAGRSFIEWTPDGPTAYNPLGRGTPTEIADKALAAEQFSEPHYLRQAQRYLGLILHAMRAAGDWPASLSTIVRYFDSERLEALAERCDDDLRGRIGDYLREQTTRSRGELAGVRDRLAVLAESELGRWLEPGESELDLAAVLERRDVAYIQLDADRFPLASQMLGAALVVDLVNVTSGLHGSEPSGLVVIDEFAALAAEQVSRLLSRSRSAGLSVLLGTQSFADLTVARPNDLTDSLRRQVLADVDYVLAHRQSEPEAAEILAAMAGTQPTWTQTRHTQTRMGASAPAEEGTRKRTREFVRHPDEFKRLGVGEAILIEPTGRRESEAVRVWWPPSCSGAMAGVPGRGRADGERDFTVHGDRP